MSLITGMESKGRKHKYALDTPFFLTVGKVDTPSFLTVGEGKCALDTPFFLTVGEG